MDPKERGCRRSYTSEIGGVALSACAGFRYNPRLALNDYFSARAICAKVVKRSALDNPHNGKANLTTDSSTITIHRLPSR